MAWPNSRKRTYIDGVTQIPAEDMNDIQDGIIAAASNLSPAPNGPSIGSDVDQIATKDAAGHKRFRVDHLGYPNGPINTFREEWKTPISTTVSGSPIAANTVWFQTTHGTVAGVLTNAPSATYPGNTLSLLASNTSGSSEAIATSQQVAAPACTFASYELDFDFKIPLAGANNSTHWAGFSGSQDPSTPANGFAWFRKASTDTNWQCETNDGTTTTTVSSGVPPVANTMQRFRVELHGSASPYGSCARFFINEALVASIATHMPTAVQYMAFGSNTTATATTAGSTVGTVELYVNRVA